MTDGTTYRENGVTVWFEKMPETNPFNIKSEFGAARTIGRGNSFDEADIYREALEEIIYSAGSGKVVDIAEKALDRINAGQGLKAGAASLADAIRKAEGGEPPTPTQSFA